MSEKGLDLLLGMFEALKAGLESDIDSSDKETFNKILGRMLDAVRDNRAYAQGRITEYVVWLSTFRRNDVIKEHQDLYKTSVYKKNNDGRDVL